jgi:hypothetical protein
MILRLRQGKGISTSRSRRSRPPESGMEEPGEWPARECQRKRAFVAAKLTTGRRMTDIQMQTNSGEFEVPLTGAASPQSFVLPDIAGGANRHCRRL